MNSDTNQEWLRLYRALQGLCLRFGTEYQNGKGDFLLVDDNWDGVSQKLVVYNPQFFRPLLVREIASYIRKLDLIGAMVLIIFDRQALSVSIDADGVVDEEEVYKLREVFGSAFYRD